MLMLQTHVLQQKLTVRAANGECLDVIRFVEIHARLGTIPTGLQLRVINRHNYINGPPYPRERRRVSHATKATGPEPLQCRRPQLERGNRSPGETARGQTRARRGRKYQCCAAT